MVVGALRVERRFVKEKEAKILLTEFSGRTGSQPKRLPDLKPPLEVARVDNVDVFFAGGKPLFARVEGRLFPTLVRDELLLGLARATVNMGAVPFVCNGADVMAPGIVGFEGKFKVGDFVVVVDERHHRPIAIAEALFDSGEAEKLGQGKVLKNVHYVGDKVWKAVKQL